MISASHGSMDLAGVPGSIPGGRTKRPSRFPCGCWVGGACEEEKEWVVPNLQAFVDLGAFAKSGVFRGLVVQFWPGRGWGRKRA